MYKRQPRDWRNCAISSLFLESLFLESPSLDDDHEEDEEDELFMPDGPSQLDSINGRSVAAKDQLPSWCFSATMKCSLSMACPSEQKVASFNG